MLRPSATSRCRAAALLVAAALAVLLAAPLLAAPLLAPRALAASAAQAQPAAATPADNGALVPGTPPGYVGPVAGYAGPASGEAALPGPLAHRPGNRLWFHDRAWWGLLVDTEGTVRVHELVADHGWRPTDAVVARSPSAVGEAVPAGNDVVVLGADDGRLRVTRLVYEPGGRTWLTAPGFPTDVAGVAAPDTLGLGVDDAGRPWAAWIAGGRVWVSAGEEGGLRWSPPVSPSPEPLTSGTSEAVAVVGLDGGAAVMWSDQAAQRFQVAVHREGEPLESWVVETPLQGEDMVDDHIQMAVVPDPAGDTLLAAVKTSQNHRVDGGAPLAPQVLVLSRRPGGVWDSAVASEVRDRVTRPMLAVEMPARRVHLFLQAPSTGGTIYHKESGLSAVAFPTGVGQVWLAAEGVALSDPTTSRRPVDGYTGLVVLASEAGRRYWHGEQALPVPAGGVPGTGDAEPPQPPTELLASPGEGSVTLRWVGSSDAGGWAPAGETRPAAGYAVQRDGREIARTPTTRYVDSSAPPGRVTYAVSAVDAAGNLSEPVTTTVSVSAPQGLPLWVWLTVLAVGVGAVVVIAFVVVEHAAVRRHRGAHAREVEYSHD